MIKVYLKKLPFIAVILMVAYFLFFKEIEVIAPGSGLTGIKESNVSVKAPSNSYIVELMVSQGDEVKVGQPLLRYRNLIDEHQLAQTTDEVTMDLLLLERYKEERCYLTGTHFNESKLGDFQYVCSGQGQLMGAGGLYILSFYQDYLHEKEFLLQLGVERQNRERVLIRKRNILIKKRTALRRGNGETLRFYDLETEVTDLDNELVAFSIEELEGKKKLNDKRMIFQMRRSERLLSLDEKIDVLDMTIIEKTHQRNLLLEKQSKTIIRSPIEGNILEFTDGIASGTFVQEATPLFILKKQGASQEVIAKFDSRYRNFLKIGRVVKLRINTPGFSEVFDGKIIELSSDSIVYDEQNKAGSRYYRVTIEPDEQFLSLSLNLGIDVEVFVVNDQINVLEFILSVLPSDIKFDVW
ncbi:MAG: HlyD family efflux transporter periplasmic adaptor subunit [Gammaproteobacteria bacterium]|nr:HlyD family efflux transporter periplasmic adaptor subunit [Gammaproteobacteria bacterium]